MVRCHSIRVIRSTAASVPCWYPVRIRVIPISTSYLGIMRRKISVGHPAAKRWTCSNTTPISITRRTRYTSFRSARSSHQHPRHPRRLLVRLQRARLLLGHPAVRLRRLRARAHRQVRVNSRPASSRVNRVVSSNSKAPWMPAAATSARTTDHRLHSDTCTRIITLTWAWGIPC